MPYSDKGRARQSSKERTARYRKRHPERVKAYKASNASKESDIRYRIKHLERERTRGKMLYQQRRSRIFEFFGCACAKCGFDDPRALQVDHINGGGYKEMKGRESSFVIITLIKADPMEARRRYQILCANCNVIKRVENGEHAPPRKYGLIPETASTITED